MSVLWYDKPAALWEHALPVGNGQLGGMVFGGPRREQIALNESSFWSGGPHEGANPAAREAIPEVQRLINEGEFDKADAEAQAKVMGLPPRQASYQPIGDLIIEMEGMDQYAPTKFRRQLDLDTAMASVEYTTSQIEPVTYRRDVVVSPDRQVMAVHITCDRPKSVDVNITLASPQPNTSVAVDGAELVMSGTNGPENGIPGALRFEVRTWVKHDGQAQDPPGMVQVRGASKVTIFLAIATSYKKYNDVSGDPSAITREHIAQCDLDFASLAKETAASHQALYRRVKLDVGENKQASLPLMQRLVEFADGAADPGLVSLYFNYGRYLLITSSRPGGQPANLQGIWNPLTTPSWGSKYTVNINTEMNYWPAEGTALPEMLEPLISMIRDISTTGKKTAKVMYGAEGWVCHHNTDLWRGTAPIDGPKFGLWPTGGAWLCRHLWDHYDYSRDLDFLKSIYPILLGSSQFFLDTLVKDRNGKYLVTNPSVSPENEHGLNGSRSTLTAGPTMDNAILRDLFAHTIEAGELLSVDHELRPKLAQARAKLPPNDVGRNGKIKEWMDEVDNEPEPHHRHTSHLFGLHPSQQIDPVTTPELAAACAKSLKGRGEPGIGWAAAWRVNLWARLHNGEEAGQMLRELLADYTFPNMFNIHPPLDKWDPIGVFQIDGNFGGCSGILEMLVQSPAGTDDVILLPALPSYLANGSISGVRVRGDWTVSLEWKDSQPVKVTLEAGHEATKKLRYGGAEKAVSLKAGQKAVLGEKELGTS